MKTLPSLRQLRYLVALAGHGHFGRAASSCNVTQSAFSAAIQELETTLDASLVERSKRHVLITPLGREVVERARAILRAAEDLAEAVTVARAPLSGALRLGVIPTIGPYLFPKLLPRLRRAFPALQLYVREEQTASLVDKLKNGALDLLLLAKPYDLDPAIETLDVGADELLVACAVDHALAQAKRVTPDLLARETLLLLEDGHCLRSQALSACGLAARRNEAFQGTSLRTLLQMVASGLGVTLIPRLALHDEVPSEKLVAVRPLGPGRQARTVALAWRRTSARKAEFARLAPLIAAELARK